MAVIWICGNSGAGKTTLAKELAKDYTFVHLDGDDLRSVWTLGFSREDRFEQNLRTARLAKMMHDQGHRVIVTLICPYEELRDAIDKICQPIWFYLPGGQEASEKYPFEEPQERATVLNTIPGKGNATSVALALSVATSPIQPQTV